VEVDWGKALSPGHERPWLILLGGIVRIIFNLKHGGCQILGLKSRGLSSSEYEGGKK
jgi:hypothetical protein